MSYLIGWTSPFLPDDQPNWPRLALFFMALLAWVGSIGILVAAHLHQRWPALAGRNSPPRPLVAVRQGILFALAITLIALLALLKLFDLTFVLIILLLAGLTEAFLQQK